MSVKFYCIEIDYVCVFCFLRVVRDLLTSNELSSSLPQTVFPNPALHETRISQTSSKWIHCLGASPSLDTRPSPTTVTTAVLGSHICPRAQPYRSILINKIHNVSNGRRRNKRLNSSRINHISSRKRNQIRKNTSKFARHFEVIKGLPSRTGRSPDRGTFVKKRRFCRGAYSCRRWEKRLARSSKASRLRRLGTLLT